MSDSQTVDLWSLSDLSTPWCLHVVVTLRIAERINAGKQSIAELANDAGCDAYSLQSVLRHLVTKGLFVEPEPAVFDLNSSARQLLDPGVRLGLDLNGIGGRMAHAWSTLLQAVTTGKPGYADRFGLPFWEDLAANPKIRASFDDLIGPGGHGTPDPHVLIDGDWEEVRTVVDVGGGTGSLLVEILRAHPRVSGTLVELSRTIENAAALIRSSGVTERITLVAQSFFDPLPAEADLYILKSILNDWPDSDALRLLRRCRDAIAANGRVVVIGGVSDSDRSRPISIELVLVGGRDRSLSEFHDLARSAGFEIAKTGHQPSGRFIVELIPD